MIMYPVALHTDVISFTPSLMMSAAIAMNIGERPLDRVSLLIVVHGCAHNLVPTMAVLTMAVLTMAVPTMAALISCLLLADYNLFMLSRYREELQQGKDVATAVVNMLRTAGHTISVSGSTLALCFFGLCFFPGA